MGPFQLSVTLLFCYLLGSISFGKIMGFIYNQDIQRMGSGNIGMTNVLRILGPGPAVVVFLGDFLKGTLAVFLARAYAAPVHLSLGFLTPHPPFWIILGGFLAIVGHAFSVFLKFKGGKGAATGLGVLLGLAPDLFLIVSLSAIVIIAITRIVSLASLICVVLLSILMFVFHKPLEYALFSCLVALLMIIRHLPNIERLMSGKESKIGERIGPGGQRPIFLRKKRP